ncbi:MAG: hypothetical protein CVU89_09195 [Firmicutes bacterium HGW-Firmicutes-14]|nr:MAG: hypothetical protein CVU89_09195 [Firmicutes bacterium HGW-Firmicutes-14]
MKFLSKVKQIFNRNAGTEPGLDWIEVTVPGVHAKLVRKLPLPLPHEVSVFIPRLEIKKKVAENNKTTETSIVLNSLTLVSAPRHEPVESRTGPVSLLQLSKTDEKQSSRV